MWTCPRCEATNDDNSRECATCRSAKESAPGVPPHGSTTPASPFAPAGSPYTTDSPSPAFIPAPDYQAAPDQWQSSSEAGSGSGTAAASHDRPALGGFGAAPVEPSRPDATGAVVSTLQAVGGIGCGFLLMLGGGLAILFHGSFLSGLIFFLLGLVTFGGAIWVWLRLMGILRR